MYTVNLKRMLEIREEEGYTGNILCDHPRDFPPTYPPYGSGSPPNKKPRTVPDQREEDYPCLVGITDFQAKRRCPCGQNNWEPHMNNWSRERYKKTVRFLGCGRDLCPNKRKGSRGLCKCGSPRCGYLRCEKSGVVKEHCTIRCRDPKALAGSFGGCGSGLCPHADRDKQRCDCICLQCVTAHCGNRLERSDEERARNLDLTYRRLHMLPNGHIDHNMEVADVRGCCIEICRWRGADLHQGADAATYMPILGQFDYIINY